MNELLLFVGIFIVLAAFIAVMQTLPLWIRFLFPCIECDKRIAAKHDKEAFRKKYQEQDRLAQLEGCNVVKWYNESTRKDQRRLSLREIEDRMMSYVTKNIDCGLIGFDCVNEIRTDVKFKDLK